MAHTEQTKTHETDMKLRCPMCGAEYKSQEELDQHKREAHPNE
ncbi:MAG: C2H2-type zinc finger protein [bacterium]